MKKSIQQAKLFEILSEYEKKTIPEKAQNISQNFKSPQWRPCSYQNVARIGAIVGQSEYWSVQLHKKIAQHSRDQKKIAHKFLQLCDDFCALGSQFQAQLDSTISLSLMNKTNLLIKRLEDLINMKSQKISKSKNDILMKKIIKKIQKISTDVYSGMLIESHDLYQQCGDLVHLAFSPSLKNQLFCIGYLDQKNIHHIAKKLKKLDFKLHKIKQKLVQE